MLQQLKIQLQRLSNFFYKIKATKSAAFVGATGFVARLRDCDPNVKL